jgi:hypothetical protein
MSTSGPDLAGLQEEVRRARSAGDRAAEARALRALGVAQRDVGRRREAVHSLSAALAIFRDLDDLSGATVVMSDLGDLAPASGSRVPVALVLLGGLALVGAAAFAGYHAVRFVIERVSFADEGEGTPPPSVPRVPAVTVGPPAQDSGSLVRLSRTSCSTPSAREAVIRVTAVPRRDLVVLVLRGELTDRRGRQLAAGTETLTDLRRGRAVRTEIRAPITGRRPPRTGRCSVEVVTAAAFP